MSSSSQQPPSPSKDSTRSESLSILMEARFFSPKISSLCYRLLDQLDQQGQLDLLALLAEVEAEAQAAQVRPGLLAPLVQQVLQAQQVQAVLLGQLEHLVLQALKECKALKETQVQPDPLEERARRVLPALLDQLEESEQQDRQAQRGPLEGWVQQDPRDQVDPLERLALLARKAYRGSKG